MGKQLSVAKRSLLMTGSFEAEILVMLLLKNWEHPHHQDDDFRQSLLDCSADVLQTSVQGKRLFEEISPANVNLIAALCYAEATTLSGDPSIPQQERAMREKWIESIRRSMPSCFCEPDLLF